MPLQYFLKPVFVFLVALLACTSCHSSKKTSSSNTSSNNHEPLKRKELKRKYAKILETKSRKIKNKSLYYFIDSWDDVKYKWGGNDKQGVDCSGFVCQLYSSVYGQKIKRTVATQHQTTRNFTRIKRLREGDLIYFKDDEEISHVGIYLKNGYFVHSSKGRGVHISNLNENYWRKAFTDGGKVRRK